MNEQEFTSLVQATIKKDMQELLNGQMKEVIDLVASVYEKGFMNGIQFHANLLQNIK